MKPFSQVLALGFSALLFLVSPAGADVERLPDRKGFSLSHGLSYSPHGDVAFSTVTYVLDKDHGRVWGNDGPPALRFRGELTAGLANVPELRFLGSANMMAVRYIDFLVGPFIRPYVEGGIGIIFTDFQVSGQGLRWNFNPQLGLGVEIQAGPTTALYVGARLHHVSNGGLASENRGINSVLLMTGVLFQ